MDRITLTLESNSGSFPVPWSTGYQTYGALLSVLDSADPDVADDIHEASFASLTNSGLLGPFNFSVDRSYHKGVIPGTEYELRIGITHPDDKAVFDALTKALVIENREFETVNGSFNVTGIEPENTTHEEILTTASDIADKKTAWVEMTFETTTCCARYDDVWETHPDRVHLFSALADRWNATAPKKWEIALTEQALGEDVFAVPDPDTYDTRSIVVHRREPSQGQGTENGDNEQTVKADGGEHYNEAQGFTGTWQFKFKNASKSTRTAVIALARFAEFGGVGYHTARGAGTVSVRVPGEGF